MKSYIKAAALGLAMATATVTSSLAAGVEVNATPTGLAMRGYDPVSYFHGGPKEGLVDIVAEYEDATYRFASEENKKEFLSDPASYAPAYGGYCAYGASLGYKFDGDPKLWKIVDDVLYLNLSPKVVGLWNKDISGNLEKSDTHWETIKYIDPSDL